MQQHSFKHCAFHYMPLSSSFIFAYVLEKIGVCYLRIAFIRRQKWRPDYDPDITECLRGSWLFDRKASQAGRVCFFPPRVTPSLARVCMDGKVRQTARAQRPRCKSNTETVAISNEVCILAFAKIS